MNNVSILYNSRDWTIENERAKIQNKFHIGHELSRMLFNKISSVHVSHLLI
jgi:hypothetical protein